mmetsp:Transcript_88780/g.192267  ORF Transcript_88780/g.192267 Transcript_88780/m.192267 type:complete len:118 (+) Transcript_88780:256-609(+)
MPTLHFCWERELEIKMFKPKKYFTMDFHLKWENHPVGPFHMNEKGLKIWEENFADYQAISNTNDVEVTKVEIKESVVKRPYPMNTVSMLKAASENLGMSPQQTMHVAERLYLSGYTT